MKVFQSPLIIFTLFKFLILNKTFLFQTWISHTVTLTPSEKTSYWGRENYKFYYWESKLNRCKKRVHIWLNTRKYQKYYLFIFIYKIFDGRWAERAAGCVTQIISTAAWIKSAKTSSLLHDKLHCRVQTSSSTIRDHSSIQQSLDLQFQYFCQLINSTARIKINIYSRFY